MNREEHENAGKQAAEGAARHLANLIGTEVAGFTPVTRSGGEPQLDLDVELARHNIEVGRLTILAALVAAEAPERSQLLKTVTPDLFRDKSFDQFLYSRIAAAHRQGQTLSPSELEACVQEFGHAVWNEPSDERSLQGHRFTVTQVLNLRPTRSHVEHSISLVQTLATKGRV